jgi:predicted naringenin-chalcone synthase
MHVQILGLGTALPPHRLSQAEALAMAHRICCSDDRQKRLATALYTHSGIENRYTVVPASEADRWLPMSDDLKKPDISRGPTTQQRMAYYEQHALPLALAAARESLRDAAVAPGEITHVVTASCTGFAAPGVDCGLVRELGLKATTERVHVGYMGCHAAINALRVARGLIQANSRACVLVCAVELCSLHYSFQWQTDRMLGNALFADGAGALVLSAGVRDDESRADRRWGIAATGSCVFPNTAELMTWRIADDGFEMTISPRLPEVIAKSVPGWLHAWLDAQGMTVQGIASWAIHPGGPRIVEAVEAALDLSPGDTRASREVLRQHGNMSSATLLFIVRSLIEQGARTPCVMLGFGPGLAAEAGLLL